MKKLTKNLTLILLVFLVLVGLFSFSVNPQKATSKIDITSMIDKINQGQVKSIKIIDNNVVLNLADNSVA